MKLKYLTISLLLVAACSGQTPKEIPVWDFTSDDPSAAADPSEEVPAEPSSEPSTEPVEEPSYEPSFEPREYTETDMVSITNCYSTDCSIVAEYTFNSLTTGYSYGLCWNSGREDIYQSGPAKVDGKVFQVIPGALLSHGKEYSVRVYLKKDDEELFSPAATATIKDAPAAIELQWNKLTYGVLPQDAIQLYETTSQVEGRNFHAWYAVADLSKVDLRVNVPSEAKTIEEQSAEDGKCIMMINGGYFYAGRHTGLAVLDGVQTGTVPSVRGSLRSADEEYNQMYFVTRGVFGVGEDGKPAVYWAGTDGATSYYFDRPLPSVRGENKYERITPENPAQAVSWSPKWALSAGPVLLKNGEIVINFDETEKGTEYYLNNFEIMPYDIFGPGSVCDRTAVGYTADGKAVLFTCDGRIPSSPGLNLVELARVLKGIGCVEAVNFDGGGSTGMMVGTLHLGDQTAEVSRKVVSTIGLYKK